MVNFLTPTGVTCLQVTREHADVQQTIDNLIKAIEDKEIFIKVAQSRLQERTQRLGCENCHDRPMIGLVNIRRSTGKHSRKEMHRCN